MRGIASRDAGGGDVFIEVLFQTVVTRNFMLLAAFFARPDPATTFRADSLFVFPTSSGCEV